MQSSSNLAALLSMLLPRIPFFLVCIGGVAFSLAQMNSHRKPAVFVLIGSLALLTGFMTSVGMTFLTLQRAQNGGSAAELGAMLSILGIGQALLSAAGYALLIWAAFVDRTSTTQLQHNR